MVYIRDFGSWIPPRIVTNSEIGEQIGASHEWIVNVSGIEERRFASDHETVESMAVRASKDCLYRSGIGPEAVGMVMVASGSSGRAFPGPAAIVAKRLGCESAVALDLPMASAGSLFGISLASRLADRFGEILVVGAEKMSSIILREPMERGVAALFGDGAGACLVSSKAGKAKILESVIASDGSYADDLKLEFEKPITMNGRSVILQASRKIPAAIQTVLERSGISVESVGAFLLHQANQNLIDKVAQAIGVTSNKFYSNIRKYGNTSSASMLIAAAEWSREGGFQKGVPVVFAAFGAGFHWGAAVVKP